ncbi:MAG: DUF72 domain-containing protein [Hydrococcus sp. C42_A2020_068]|uniref:DUF72 domain-containing protein n=1 Tax=Pleurocapsa sp. PCC 7327 TaxID=118163 RepID=UPI00029FC58C|nr:DUF72 domain-containing protein [Pleurocapsa sp. PCC 7327]AFY75816.1 hypothetical protein Ple7327_0355 [Pleurocapsa sp. PCC 7327]MBF2020406.1 DUF72 domain-containing protein [Hydrococcus sp. C42_A2020_068]
MQVSKLVHIGTSGWHYQHWRDVFYPKELVKKDWLKYYAQHFRTVEINNSFYKLPSEETLKKWRDTVPADFTFSVKASRYITHQKKLKDPQQTLHNLLERLTILGDKLGPILFQLPPYWHCDRERLNEFLLALPKDYRYAFEFRDRSWFNPQVYEMLSTQKVAFCIYELAEQLSPKEITANFTYWRFHGSDGAYQGQYSIQKLIELANIFSNLTRLGKEIYCYFDNDECGYAARDALKLQAIIRENSE